MRVALIACDHGLGHVRRCYLVALALAKRGIKVDIFSPKKKFEKFCRIFPKHRNISNLEFSSYISCKKDLRPGALKKKIFQKFSVLSSYDRVVSDNFPEILELRHDAILSGHFLWCNVFKDTPQSYKDYVKKLILKYNPIIIASSLFACAEIQNAPRYVPTGLYTLGPDYLNEPKRKRAVLVAGGATNHACRVLKSILPSIFNFCAENKLKLFLDSNLIDQFSRSRHRKLYLSSAFVEKADYTHSMYSQVHFGIVRPGVGTVTDLLAHGAFPVCIYEKNNSEMIYNANTLAKKGLGLDWKQGPYFLSNYLLKKVWNLASNFKSRISTVNFSGAEEAAQIILNF